VSVPPFKSFYPSESELNSEQKEFFRGLKSNIERRIYPPVEGQISYLFILAYDLLAKVCKAGYESLYDKLLDLAEAYNTEEVFAIYCRQWSYDCLLATRQYDRFLELTEPETIWGTQTHFSNTRLNVQYKKHRPANAIDLFKMTNGSAGDICRGNETLFRDALIECAHREARKSGAWFKRFFLEKGPKPEKYTSWLFAGAPVDQPRFPGGIYCFYAAPQLIKNIVQFTRDAENMVRDRLGVPRVGEGWIQETVLYTILRKAFPETQVIHHGRPDWLGRQHFDIWFPRWRIAVEYHGRQHFEPVEFFGGEVGFADAKRRDSRKAELSRTNNVDLIVADETTTFGLVAEWVRQSRATNLAKGNLTVPDKEKSKQISGD